MHVQPQTHLFLSPEEWSRLPDKLSDLFFAQLLAANSLAIEGYEKLQGAVFTDLPEDMAVPDSPRRSGASCRPLKGRLLRAAIALYAGRDEGVWDFALRSIDYLLDPAFWKPTARGCRIRHYDLKMGDLLFCAAFVLDTFADRLDSERLERLRALTITHGLAAYLAGWEAEEWWKAADFNWASATHGNAGLAALALAETHPQLSEDILRKVREGLAPLIAAFPLDGWWTEGAMYHTTAIGHLSDFVIALYRTRGDDLGLSAHPRWLEALAQRRQTLAPDGRLLNFSNCAERTTQVFCPQIYWWAEHLGKPEWVTFEDSILKPWSRVFGVFYDIEAFLYRPAHPEKPPLAPLPPLQHFRGLDWLTWRGGQTWLAFRGGFNGGNHNNLDLGHFILGRGRRRYLADPGYGLVRTSEHNAVTIHGQDQAKGARAPLLAHGRLEGGFYLACDLAQCYPHLLEKHLRILLLLGDAHLLAIDSLGGRGEFRVGAGYHFVTGRPVSAEAGAFTLAGADGEGDLHVQSLTPIFGADLTAFNGDRGPLSRITFQADADRHRELSVILLSFDPVSAPQVHPENTADRLRIVWAGHNLDVDINTGAVHG